ncbi:zinc finger fyve/phd-type [Holotrichia oblita]|uniref:Zinc finger fyve/phd-type n=1 Tax=Holotrichia oblita TaxID=644536 RepID=A0ACB9TYH8_HOLOL|nr:zinc finger fyve/phd-type [Holotrichia oblita]
MDGEDTATPSTPPGPLNTETLLPAAPTKTYYTPEQVRPFPKADFSKQKNTKPRQKGKTAIITDTPERTLIEKRYNKRKVTSVKKTLVMANKSNNKQRKCVKKRKIIEETSKESFEDETLCLICCGVYSVSKEDWLQCRQCKNWAHSSCAKNNPLFVCCNCGGGGNKVVKKNKRGGPFVVIEKVGKEKSEVKDKERHNRIESQKSLKRRLEIRETGERELNLRIERKKDLNCFWKMTDERI